MKTKIKRHSRSALSVLLTLCMLISCMTVGIIATDAAKVAEENAVGASADSEAVGYSDGGYVKGAWDGWKTPDDNKGHKITNGYTVQLPANTTYEFVFVADNDDVFKKDVTISSSVNDYDFNKDATVNAKIKTSIAGDYTFKFASWNGDNCMRVKITFPTQTTVDTWSVAGGSGGVTAGGQPDNLFTDSWSTSLTENQMTNTSGTTWTWTKNNVSLPEGKILCKVVKNHSWDTAYPSSGNQESSSLAAGEYNVTITFDSSTKVVTITATSVAKSTLYVQSDIANATVTATYNGETANEGGSISSIPQGATVTISVTPAAGYQCTGITSSGGGTISGSINSYTLKMPAQNTTVDATITTVMLKRIYFNNNYTQYGTVYAYVYNKDGDTITYEYLGKRPGKVMAEPENSEMWYIEVPSNITYVEFISGDGKTTGEMTIPWSNTNPKYIAPYNYDAPTEANGGKWGNYVPGDKVGDQRDNVYTVSDGTTMSSSNLFTGITATMYDYYTDGEINANAGTVSDTGASGAPNGWLKGIASDEYSGGTSWKWHPYDKLNAALSKYADASKTRDNATWSNPSQPLYGIAYPLYFGNLNTKNGGDSMANYVAGLFNWDFGTNNSLGLNSTNNAATGLSGKTLGKDNTIHYYKSGATDENGAPMAMFNEDFLSGENSQNKPLATILHTSSFPVRKEENVGATTTYPNKIYMAPGAWAGDSAVIFAHFHNGTDKKMTSDGTYLVCDIPSGATGVTFVRMPNGSARVNWGSAWNQSDDYSVETSTGSASRLYTFDSWDGGGTYGDNNSKKKSTFTKGDIPASYGTTSGGHTYYEFNSTGGKDNAYITDISKSNKTANINYYTDKKVKSSNDIYGFFPFDYNTYQSHLDSTAHDLGFGMKLEIPFTLNENGLNDDGTPQTFDFSGDDDLWVFVDGKLVLDLGGAHDVTTGSINFNTKTVTASNVQAIPSGVTRNGSFGTGFNTNPNYVHTMTIYYMERGMFDSNLKFGFSFHAIPNQFWIDKKIRTKDRTNTGEYDTINAGFFTDNKQTGTASNMDTYTVGGTTTTMSKFEKSFQNEQFTVTHWYGTNGASTANTLAAGMNYTIDNNTVTQTVDANGQYHIYHDLGNAFIDQFKTGDKFKLKEEISSSNKYVYTPVFSVWDQANNDKTITPGGDNTNGYTFDFSPTTSVSGGIENTNIKARFENYMVAHDLTLTKKITNATDTTTNFTFKILFDFANDGNYIAYPLYCDVDGARTQLSNTGEITVKAGQVIDIFEIPENAKIQITEVLTDTVSGYRYVGATLKKGGTDLASNTYTTITKGVQFRMGDADMSAEFSNKKPDNKYTITYIYPSYGASAKSDSNLYGDQSYTVSGVFTAKELETYMDLSGSSIVFKSDALKRTFVNNKAPYEDNFMQTLSFASSDIVESGTGWSGGNYTCSVTAAASTNYTVGAYFYLPYAVDNDSSLIPQESGNSGKVAYTTSKTARGEKEVTCFDWYVTSGKTHKGASGDAPVFVNAPLIVYSDVSDESTKKYFQYWSVKSQSGYGKRSAEYTRCYDYEFNLALFMDCYIEPIYADTWAQPVLGGPTSYDDYSRYNPEIQITGTEEQNISISFLENSRNQYNNNGGGTRTGSAADVIYSDFLLNFNYNSTDGLVQLNELDEGKKKAGLVVEALGNMDYETGSTTVFDYDKNYSRESSFNSDEATKRGAIISWLQGGNKPAATGYAKAEFDVKALDNKNCIQYFYALNNRKNSDGTLLNTLQNRYKVFRAYAYIGDVSGNTLTSVKLSTPVYFTIYDVGCQGLADNATNNS